MNWQDIPKQTFLREDGKIGDCWRCCIAAVLQVPAEIVPHFLLEDQGNGGCSVDERTQAWLNERGFVLLRAKTFAITRDCVTLPTEYPRIICGPSPRSKHLGQHHACIAIADRLVYDPHPAGTGLTAITDEYMVVPVLQPARKTSDQIINERVANLLDHHKSFFAAHGVPSTACSLEECQEEALTWIADLRGEKTKI